jgi:ADP-ribose pyrophosphatase YjhB (NUDIX family)
MANFPPDFCPYCGSELESVDEPTVYRCGACDDWVFHNAVLGCGIVVVDGDELLLVEDFRGPGTWKIPEGVPEIPESPREGAARELEEETGLVVDPDDLVYCYDVGKENHGVATNPSAVSARFTATTSHPSGRQNPARIRGRVSIAPGLSSLAVATTPQTPPRRQPAPNSGQVGSPTKVAAGPTTSVAAATSETRRTVRRIVRGVSRQLKNSCGPRRGLA